NCGHILFLTTGKQEKQWHEREKAFHFMSPIGATHFIPEFPSILRELQAYRKEVRRTWLSFIFLFNYVPE
ncbi:MAG: hypothetical protein DWQ10_10345, partial [Calditrichaeota bacterium]